MPLAVPDMLTASVALISMRPLLPVPNVLAATTNPSPISMVPLPAACRMTLPESPENRLCDEINPPRSNRNMSPAWMVTSSLRPKLRLSVAIWAPPVMVRLSVAVTLIVPLSEKLSAGSIELTK